MHTPRSHKSQYRAHNIQSRPLVTKSYIENLSVYQFLNLYRRQITRALECKVRTAASENTQNYRIRQRLWGKKSGHTTNRDHPCHLLIPEQFIQSTQKDWIFRERTSEAFPLQAKLRFTDGVTSTTGPSTSGNGEHDRRGARARH